MIGLTDHFSEKDKHSEREAIRNRRWFIKAREDRLRREEVAERADTELVDLAMSVALATQAQIEAFQIKLQSYEARLDDYEDKLNAYDEAVTKALMDRLSRVAQFEKNHAELQEDAFRLPDGTRVYRSKAGDYVIDDNGSRVSSDIVEAVSIPDGFTYAEDYQASLDAIEVERRAIDQLHQEQEAIDQAREQISEAREKISTARDQIEEGGLSVSELDDLDREIADAIPTTLPKLSPQTMKYVAGASGRALADNETSTPKTLRGQFPNSETVVEGASPEERLSRLPTAMQQTL